MASDKIRQWIQKKLEKGVDKERIKRSLENTGHDPSLVEEVEKSSKIGDDPFQQEKDSNEVHESGSEQTGNGVEEDEETREMELGFDSNDKADNSNKDNNDGSTKESDESGLGISVPSVPSIDFNKRALMIIGASFIIVTSMAGFFTYVETSNVLEPQCSGDEGAGVKVYSVESQDGVTTAEVRVVEEVPVILEVFDSNEKIGEKVQKMNGRGTISVNVVGNRVSFHEYGCDEPSVERNY